MTTIDWAEFMSLNRKRLEKVGGVTLSVREFAELNDVVTLYKQTQSELPLHMADHFIGIQLHKQGAEKLRAVTQFVWFIWRDAGGSGHGARWDDDPLIQGPFIRFMQQLFHDGGMKEPSARTLRRYLQSFRDEAETFFREYRCRAGLQPN